MVYSLNNSVKFRILSNMFRIRTIEEKISKKYSEQKMRCPVHLSIGQELVPSIFQCLVKKDDFAVSTHRGHAHYLGKGGNLNAMLAEIYGKQTGCSGGFGTFLTTLRH